MPLHAGDAAPDFDTLSHTGERVRLSALRGRWVLLYFYPMDDTPGCTRQACSLRDAQSALTARQIDVLGVSAQDVGAHRAFATKHRLGFPLLLDTDRTLARAYGALGHGLSGWLRARLGLYRRISYLIDPHGRIACVFDRPDIRRHGEQALAHIGTD